MEEVKKERKKKRRLAKIVYANQQRTVKNISFSSVVIAISLLTYSSLTYRPIDLLLFLFTWLFYTFYIS